jgi:para-nitrobenzyl esterase
MPVLVWLHGGGFVSGGAREYNGTELATTGDMIVVTINYRLGALGFLSTPQLGTNGGNYGLMDQTAALRWVQRNATRFGGNPNNVTLAGQSAGARAVCAQLASPASRNLFHRAIIQSGACANPVLTLAEAQRFGNRATQELGCATTSDVAECLRERDPADLLTTLATVGQEVNGRTNDRPWGPVAGTPVLPQQPRDALRTGSAARVPLLIGGTHDEMRGFISDEAALTAQKYRDMITKTFGDNAEAVLAEYPVTAHDSPALALATVLGDWGGSVGACPVLQTAQTASTHQPTYAYEFAENSGQVQEGYSLGSYHGLDLSYVWDLNTAWNPYPDLTPDQEHLSTTIIGYWSAFTHTGNPNTPEQPPWPGFGSTSTVIGLSTDGVVPTRFATDHHCDFWATSIG